MESPRPLHIDNYPDAYRHIVKAMKGAGLSEIGDPTYREKDEFRDEEGEIRAASVDIDKLDRIARTLTVVHMSRDQVAELHKREVKAGRFLGQIKDMFHLKFGYTQMGEEVVKSVTEFQDKCRPKCSEFRGISIPPYFPPDFEFDGMIYHHSWDKGIWFQRANIYIPVSRRTSGKKMLAEVE